MITNILCRLVISLVTNVVQTDNSVMERDPFIAWPEGGGPMRLRTPATEMSVTTNISEVATLYWTWNGEEHQSQSSRLLSSVSAVLKLKQQWEPAGIVTNPLPTMVLTNFSANTLLLKP